MSITSIISFLITLIALTVAGIVIYESFEQSPNPPATQHKVQPPKVSEGTPQIERPAKPELDYAAECVWLTNNVFGPPRGDNPPASQVKFLKECAADDGASWVKCQEYSSHVWGNNSAQRSKFFFKCMEQIVKSVEASCCYNAWECGIDLHHVTHELDEMEDSCYDVCEKLPGNNSCHEMCR